MSDDTRKKGEGRPTGAPAPLRPLKYSPAGLEQLKRLSKAGAAAVERMQHEQAGETVELDTPDQPHDWTREVAKRRNGGALSRSQQVQQDIADATKQQARKAKEE